MRGYLKGRTKVRPIWFPKNKKTRHFHAGFPMSNEENYSALAAAFFAGAFFSAAGAAAFFAGAFFGAAFLAAGFFAVAIVFSLITLQRALRVGSTQSDSWRWATG